LLVKFDEGTDHVSWNGCPEINITYHFAKQFDPYCFFHVPWDQDIFIFQNRKLEVLKN